MPAKNRGYHQEKHKQDILQWTVPRLIGAGYGLFSKKAANPRWPEFIITAFVLRKYRGVSSFWFMISNAMKGMRKHEIAAGEAKIALARLIGSKPRDLFRLTGIYRALHAEKGPAVATAAIIEIVRITNEKRTRKKRRLKKNESHPHTPRGRFKRTKNRGVARSTPGRK